MVLASSNEGCFILDPFAGSGTTLRVCQVLNRNCIGFEVNPEYVDLIKDRLAKKDLFSFDSFDERINRKPKDLPEDRKKQERNSEKNSGDILLNLNGSSDFVVHKKQGFIDDNCSLKTWHVLNMLYTI